MKYKYHSLTWIPSQVNRYIRKYSFSKKGSWQNAYGGPQAKFTRSCFLCCLSSVPRSIIGRYPLEKRTQVHWLINIPGVILFQEVSQSHHKKLIFRQNLMTQLLVTWSLYIKCTVNSTRSAKKLVAETRTQTFTKSKFKPTILTKSLHIFMTFVFLL